MESMNPKQAPPVRPDDVTPPESVWCVLELSIRVSVRRERIAALKWNKPRTLLNRLSRFRMMLRPAARRFSLPPTRQ
jgi:hypothetical protein